MELGLPDFNTSSWIKQYIPIHRFLYYPSLIFLCRHIGKGCDRDTYSVQSQRKLCGASPSAIDLLPSPGVGAEWTKPLISDEGHESDQMFEFDGTSTAVSIPSTVLDHNLPSTFTIATWLRHGQQQGQDKHMKEHILCTADDHSKHFFDLIAEIIGFDLPILFQK